MSIHKRLVSKAALCFSLLFCLSFCVSVHAEEAVVEGPVVENMVAKETVIEETVVNELVVEEIAAEDRGVKEAGAEDLASEVRAKPWPESSLEWMEQKQQKWSGEIVNLAHYIDGLMGDVDAIQDANQSYLKIYLGFEESRLYDFKEQLSARFSLDLPIIKKKLRLIVENDDSEPQESNSISSELIGDENIEDESIYASFRHMFSSKSWDRLSFDYGVKVRFKPDLFARARAVRSWKLPADWAFRFSEDVFWYESIGFGNKSGFDFDHTLSRQLLFRSASFVNWYERDSRFDYGKSFSLYQDFSYKRAMQYMLGVNAQYQDSHSVVTNYFIKINYRRNIYKQWLFYQASTGYEFPREKSYRSNPFIALRLEVLFSSDVGRRLSTSLY